jgi:hypothetical protein
MSTTATVAALFVQHQLGCFAQLLLISVLHFRSVSELMETWKIPTIVGVVPLIALNLPVCFAMQPQTGALDNAFCQVTGRSYSL